MESGQKIIELIRRSEHAISADDVLLWEELVAELPAELNDLLLQFITADTSRVAMLTKNIASKRAALLAGDVLRWDTILEEEKQYVLHHA